MEITKEKKDTNTNNNLLQSEKESKLKKIVSTKRIPKSTRKVELSESVSEKKTRNTSQAKKTLLKNKALKTNLNKSTRKIEDIQKDYNIAEYYDLPYRYNQTVIKVLAQTPHSLFIYWDISDVDRLSLTEKYGENFFNETRPVLLVHNQTLNSKFEVEIDDFTNSWYLKTPTSNCVFNIELGRKKIKPTVDFNFDNHSDTLHIATSNTMFSPNDHILNNLSNKVQFKNLNTNQIEEKEVSRNNIYNLYTTVGINENSHEYQHNPSSGFNLSICN